MSSDFTWLYDLPAAVSCEPPTKTKLSSRRMAPSKYLKLMRKYHGLQQYELAELVGCSVSSISKWETGTARPTSPFINTLASLFNQPPKVFRQKMITLTEDDEELLYG